MTRPLRLYLTLLAVLTCGWVVLRGGALAGTSAGAGLPALAAVTALYGASHLLRILRLALLSLERRDKAFELACAHALTAFPSSFLPFKTGELLRLAALMRVHGHRRKAFALWATERFGDVGVICAFILGLYLFNIDVPATMRNVFVVFLLAGLAGLFALFAIARTFIYLNRHLVLVSHSRHGLYLLRISHAMRQLEVDIARCLDGRITAFLLLSMLIWVVELGALTLFLRLTDGASDFAAMFASGLLASLPGKDAGEFGMYQSLALVVLTLIFLAAAALAARLNSTRS